MWQNMDAFLKQNTCKGGNKKSELLFAMSKLRYTIEIRNRYTENIKMRK